MQSRLVTALQAFVVGPAVALSGLHVAETGKGKLAAPVGGVFALLGVVYTFERGLSWLKADAAASPEALQLQGVYVLGKCPCAVGQPLSKCRGAMS